MIYKAFEPDPLLTNYIKNYWWCDNASDNRLNYTILPDGCFDLILSFSNDQLQRISLTGLWTQPVDISIEANTQLFGIRFKLLAVDDLLKQHIAALCDSQQIMAPDFWKLDECSFADLQNATLRLNAILLSQLGATTIDKRKLNLFNLLYQTKGNLTVSQYAQQVCWSSRQINRYFKNRFGVPLKSYCQILKSFASYRQIRKGQHYPEQNYFDQSHFIKDIKKYAGASPTALSENKNDRFLQLLR